MSNAIKIGIVDDHYLFRYGISHVIKQFEFAELVFDAENGQDFIEKQRINPADIVFLDIKMPVMNGYEALLVASREFPALKFIILTMLEGGEYFNEILKYSVQGYLLKNTDRSELETALKVIMKGQYYYCPEVSLYLRRHFNNSSNNSANNGKLTKREIEILQLIYEGYSNKEISEKLYLSLFTVKNHRYNLKRKANVKNTAGLISYGLKNTILR